MNVREIPVVFDCEGSQLIGIIHLPETIRSRGLLSVVAGGPQYRGGVCRLQVQMARTLSAMGVPVMRFDYRGLGDSEGRFQGFQQVEADIGAAVQAFLKAVPELREVVLWGGCDAASATMINAWKYPQVTGMALGNPWVHNEKTGDVVAVKHFSQRMRDMDFWLKVLRLQYNPLPALGTLFRRVIQALRSRVDKVLPQAAKPEQDDPSLPHLPRMRLGLSRFKGDLLLLMSGRSLLSREFDVLVQQESAWQQAMKAPRHVARGDLPDADQAFSAMATRADVIHLLGQWMLDPRAELSPAMRVADAATA